MHYFMLDFMPAPAPAAKTEGKAAGRKRALFCRGAFTGRLRRRAFFG